MLRESTAGVLVFCAMLLTVHGFGWLLFGGNIGSDSYGFSMVTMGIAILSMATALVLLAFAYLAMRRSKAEWSATSAVLDGDAENTVAMQEASHSFNSDPVINHYVAEKSAQQCSPPSAPVKPMAAVSSRAVFGRKAV